MEEKHPEKLNIIETPNPEKHEWRYSIFGSIERRLGVGVLLGEKATADDKFDSFVSKKAVTFKTDVLPDIDVMGEICNQIMSISDMLSDTVLVLMEKDRTKILNQLNQETSQKTIEAPLSPQTPQIPQNTNAPNPVSPAPPQQPPEDHPKKYRNHLWAMYKNNKPFKPEHAGVKQYLDNQAFKIYDRPDQEAKDKIEELKNNSVIPR